jgi:hypothetical protein
MLRVFLCAMVAGLGLGCVTKKPGVVQTQVISFPDGALVEFNGEPMGRAPARITLPQDEHGRLTERAEVLVLPNSSQAELFPQRRVFEPRARETRVPDRIMVDMTRVSTNEMRLARGSSTHVQTESKRSNRPTVPNTERSKPTQAVGLDRWKPGIY